MSTAPTVKVSGKDLTRTFILNGDVKNLFGNKSISFICDKFLSINKKISYKPFLIASISSKSNILIINGHRYNGVAYLLAKPKRKKCDIILKTGLEGYLSSVLAKEMNAKWPIEALKAQAVAARTYALFKMKKNRDKPYDLEGSEKDQVIGHILDKTLSTDKAVMETSGIVLFNKENKIIPAFFHAECGGYLVQPGEVWDNHIKGFAHKKDIFCSRRKSVFKWRYSLKNKKFYKFVNWLVKTKKISIKRKINKMKLMRDHRSQSYFEIQIAGKFLKIKKSWLRTYLGRFKIRSNNYALKLGKRNIFIYGRGRGHGVGLCQLGALKMAQLGYKYKEILKYYFPNFKQINLLKK